MQKQTFSTTRCYFITNNIQRYVYIILLNRKYFSLRKKKKDKILHLIILIDSTFVLNDDENLYRWKMYDVTIIITKFCTYIESVETCEMNSSFRREIAERKRKLREETRADK